MTPANNKVSEMNDETVCGYTPSIAARIGWKLDAAGYKVAKLWRGLCERMKWIGHKPGNLEWHAERELRLAGLFDSDSSYGGMLGPAVLRLVRDFAQEGHSGVSAGLALSLFKRVAAFEPLEPLTGNDDEWNEVGNGVFQSNRCSRVFKDAGGAYDIDGRVFREPDGCCYTSKGSRVAIQFPYTPTTEYVDVPAAKP